MADGFVYKGSNGRRGNQPSNEDLINKNSHSIFVTNFPNSVNSRDLWDKCKVYGTVVDVFIPNKLSKSGKRFAFVRFIKVYNIDRLVENLCTLWIGVHHLFANHVRFDRPPKPNVSKANFPPLNVSNKSHGLRNNHKSIGSNEPFVSVVKGLANPLISPSPALVLDDECINECDFSKCVMGKVKDLNSILNLKVILAEEGFENVTPFYLGGRWVMFECNNIKAKRNLLKHTGFCSWFHEIQEVPRDFVSNERVVWVDIEGVPLYAWKRETFVKIGKKWGELVDIEDASATTFGRKRLCIITTLPSSIIETFKIIIKGKVFMIRAKELFMWNPSFLDVKEKNYVSDNDSVRGDNNKDGLILSSDDEEEEGEFVSSEMEGVAETIFGEDSAASLNHKSTREESAASLNHKSTREECSSADPFEIYPLLNSKTTEEENRDLCNSLSHPPGFTPLNAEEKKTRDQLNSEVGDHSNVGHSPQISANVMRSSQVVQEEDSIHSIGNSKGNKGGSVLGVLEDIIKVGQAMGYTMEGCEKDIASIIDRQGGEVGFS
ncbi:RNA-directed DNA polymerase, eukaryota [Tanacetum coccineum]